MINKSVIKVKSFLGYEIDNLYLTHSPKSNSIVILFPGADYSCDRPILHYVRKAALLSGCDVLSLEYECLKTKETFNHDLKEVLAKDCYEAIRQCLSNCYDNIYFISKSLGTSVAGEISELIGFDKVHNMFLTPTKDAIKYILQDRCSVIVGTRDKYFDKNNIETIEKPFVSLFTIQDAGHSLEIDDDYVTSIQILSDVTNICADFVRK